MTRKKMVLVLALVMALGAILIFSRSLDFWDDRRESRFLRVPAAT